MVFPAILQWGQPPEANRVARADIEVQTPGLVEVLLPPELHVRPGNSAAAVLDVKLLGPDGRPRAFELYRRDPVGPGRLQLKAEDIRLEKKLEFTWEAPVPGENFLLHRVEVEITDREFVGRISVGAMEGGRWKTLKEDAAIFRVGGHARSAVDVPAGYYEKIRLHFTSFSKHYHRRLLPIGRVTVAGTKTGKDYAEAVLQPEFKRRANGDVHQFEVMLPGSGLEIEAVQLETEARFRGQWELGRRQVSFGEIEFRKVRGGLVRFRKSPGRTVLFPLGQNWPARSLILRLDTGGNFIGEIKGLKVLIRQVRLIFQADRTGLYTVVAGEGKSTALKESLDRPGEGTAREAVCTNLRFQGGGAAEGLRRVLEKYSLKGGPFNPEGFSWKAPVSIPRPGYYRLVPEGFTALGANPRGMRLVTVDMQTQVPFFWGPKKLTSVTITFSSQYIQEKNRTVVTFELPLASRSWKSLRLSARGIFKRRVKLERPFARKKGWRKWRHMSWENKTDGPAFLKVEMGGFPATRKQVRFSIDHGDNRPIEIEKISAFYPEVPLFFIAPTAGEYFLAGGNEKISPAVYDLDMVRTSLLELIPDEVEMGEAVPLKGASSDNFFKRLFSGEGWGLYIAFALVALFLILIIIRLFPKG